MATIVLTSASPGPWVAPYTGTIQVEAVGEGGAGELSGGVSGGAGGGGAGYGIVNAFPITWGVTYQFSIATDATWDVAGGTNPSPTSLPYGTGGVAGGTAGLGIGGAAGSGGGDSQTAGGIGGNSGGAGTDGSGGGGAAGSVGVVGGIGSPGTGGAGGAIGGAGGAGGTFGVDGQGGGGPGGGGGGSSFSGGTPGVGGGAEILLTLNYPSPVPISVDPPGGLTTGGTPVTINCTGASLGCTVYFDHVLADSIVVVDDTHITCNTPAHAAGAVDVEISNADGINNTLTDGYAYIAGGGGLLRSPGMTGGICG